MGRSIKSLPDKFEDLQDLIFSVACEEEVWPKVLDRFMRCFHASHAVLVTHQNGGKKGKVFHSRLKNPHWRHLFEDLYKGRVPFLYEARHLLRPGAVLKGDQLLPYDRLVQTDFYRNFMRPLNHYHLLKAILEARRGEVSILTLCRSKKAGAFGERDICALKALVPCLQKALRVNQQTAGARLDDIVSQDVLDMIPIGVLVMSAQGKVLAMNQRAKQLLGECDGLGIGPEGLEALRPGDNARIQKMLAGALGRPVEEGEQGTILLIPRPSGKPFYSLIFIPTTPRPAFFGSIPVGCVVLVSSFEGGESSRGIS